MVTTVPNRIHLDIRMIAVCEETRNIVGKSLITPRVDRCCILGQRDLLVQVGNRVAIPCKYLPR